MPYEDPEKQKAAVKEAQKRYREKRREELAIKAREIREHKKAELFDLENHLSYLEFEVERLTRCLNLALSKQSPQ